MLAKFLALYKGQTVSDAELLAIPAEPQIIRKFFRELLGEGLEPEKQDELIRRSQRPKRVWDEAE
jgi:hypothetical protein